MTAVDDEFRPTHVAPLSGLPTWSSPDPDRPSTWLDPLLPVQLIARQGDWGQVACANGWSAWVDGRMLVALPDSPPGSPEPLTRAPDPRALLARLEQAVSGYRQLVDQLADGQIDLETFRQRSAGLRLGIVVDGESAWLLDLDAERWYYCQGAQLQTYATVTAPPTADGAAPAGPAGGRPGASDPGASDPGAAGAAPPTRVVAHQSTRLGDR